MNDRAAARISARHSAPPPAASPPASQDRRIERACRFIDGFEEGVPTLREIADHVGLSPAWLQKRFSEALGVSPKQYADQRRRERLKSLLREGDEVTGALYEAGYGSSSRLYESSDATLGMTPATYRRGGAGARIAWTAAPCALGLLLVAATERGICFVAFDDSEAALLTELGAEFPHAEIVPDIGILEAWTAEVLRRVEGRPPRATLPLDVRATAFQQRVWRALTEIPQGETRTYSEIARSLGKPAAQRAVGRACATNPVSIVIPCHRAKRSDGGLAGYRWGVTRKEALIEAEKAGRNLSKGE
ncbi:MAG: methylated-DNA--[protein]-cysteine S-methyltransferase [Rhodospirillaceae bacterium]|nr:methylated-DNA--[protein]-cysteine S-methyltransferase [Rhodospirillaceae bacterium]MYF85948.1 methylated-DNA--[protein]-cysteine S-methyltransferase [Rhodospirillaceae bacterium]MYH39022.1 methylated-DNA--[protein]-cysteine S-methyltransferase [Rhodospirillaceae bacterium]MYK13415.1 methylated-DNA--[protein]-cysteine S-methyltransferase [Rhodospirillaceae bacterium]MYK58661.1 methylated-DNA--[protein]-cysteine S-methyltransferase [Rhodospirillaceae bacterium]